MPRVDNHTSFVIRIDFGDLVDVFRVSGFKEEIAKDLAVEEFLQKYEFPERYPQIIPITVFKHCNEQRARRYYEGYRKGLGNPVPQEEMLV